MRMRVSRIGAAVIAAAAFVGLTGCHPYSYVNVPYQEGDIALNNPNITLVAQVEAAAIKALMRNWPKDEPAQLLLPEETKPETYERVIEMLGDAPVVAAPLGALEGYPSIEVTRVNVRGDAAHVDLLMPRDVRQPEGERVKSTVTLRHRAFRGWQEVRVQLFQFSMPPLSRLAPKPQPQPESVTPDAPAPQGETPQPSEVPPAEPAPAEAAPAEATPSDAASTKTVVGE